MTPALQISIPTFNRPIELSENLESILDALAYVQMNQRNRINVAIFDNSTLYLREYQELISQFGERLKEIGCNKFTYQRTGFDIGSANNCSIAVLSSPALYTWLLPDDDLSRKDAIHTILKVIDQYSPCMIHGGDIRKSIVCYANVDRSLALFDKPNATSKILHDEKIEYFLQLNPVQAQEHVYKTEFLRAVSSNQNYVNFIDEMFPAFFSILCLNGNGPAVFTEQSLGIFRDGDPRSTWRHRWLSLYCITWPKNLKEFLRMGLISQTSYLNAMSQAVKIMRSYRGRLDILLGIRKKFDINPIILYRFFRSDYLKIIFLSLIFPRISALLQRK